jgi:2-oxo-3-(phosphooxy)propyl 3-oxoalkanoate synthase
MSTVLQSVAVNTVQRRSEQTPLRPLVHKRAPENVLLTGISTCGDDRFTCTGRLPQGHPFFNQPGRTPSKDILFYTELGRQASLAISHEFLKVSTEDVFIFEGSDATLTDAAWNSALQSVPDLVVIEVAIKDVTRRRNDAVSRVVAQHSMSIGGEPVFNGTGAWTVQPAALFRRLRRTSSGGPLPSIGTAQWHQASNVVITAPTHRDDRTSFDSTLIVDYTHPYFFDHACDHVPGMLLLEGCAQLALAAFAQATSVLPGRSAIRAYEVNFSQFVECGLPTTLAARVNAEDDVEIIISQPDVVCGTTTMRVAFPV